MNKFAKFGLILIGIILLTTLLLARNSPITAVRGKSPAILLTGVLTPENQLAQDLALTDARVIAHTTGRRAEVFGVQTDGLHYPASAAECDTADCRQVNIYNFDDNAAITAIVNLDTRTIVEVLHQPGVQPGINKRLFDVAVRIIHDSPEVAAILGDPPPLEDIYPMMSSYAGTACGSEHLCMAAVFINDELLDHRILWAHVDLTTETFAGIGWSASPGEHGLAVPSAPGGCPAPGSLSQNGWSLDYQVSGSDGLLTTNVQFQGIPVITSVKLAEWHADYGSSGYVDATGCTGGGGFPILPYGDPYTQPITVTIQGQPVTGFELVQDFRMGNWGATCNYRYEQHLQLFDDGRFRVVAGAYGKGCGSNSIYRPLIRIDLAVNGDEGDTFATWDGVNWVDELTEGWWLQGAPYTAQRYLWRVIDTTTQRGYFIEPGQAQFNSSRRGDGAYLYVVQHHPNEGDTDLGAVGTCCNDDEFQGPHQYINGESINGENLVIWYVPQFITDTTPGREYCWTIQGEPNPITYPCFGGPLFHPFGIPASGLETWFPLIFNGP